MRIGRVLRIAALLLLVPGLVLSGCSHARPTTASQTPFVATTVATSGSIDPNEQLPGLIAPYQNVAIQSTLSEPADAVYVQEGDRVHKGEVLARLDTADLQAQLASDLATAHADAASTTHTVFAGGLSISQGVDQLHSAQAAVQQAEKTLSFDTLTLERDRQLVSQGYIAQQAVDQVATTVHNDQQALRSAQASLASAESNVQANGPSVNSPGLQQSSVEQAKAQETVALANAQQVRVQIAKATVVSPIDGVVVNRNINPGEYPGTRQIFTLQQIDPVYAILQGSGAQIAQIAHGATAAIAVSDLSAKNFNGPVVGILNQIVPGSTNFQVKVRLNNPGRRLRPGMAVLGHVALPKVAGVRIPMTAFTDPNHDRVLTVDDRGIVHTVSVKELADNGITSVVTGIAAGSRVVTDGQTSIGDGEKVAFK